MDFGSKCVIMMLPMALTSKCDLSESTENHIIKIKIKIFNTEIWRKGVDWQVNEDS